MDKVLCVSASFASQFLGNGAVQTPINYKCPLKLRGMLRFEPSTGGAGLHHAVVTNSEQFPFVNSVSTKEAECNLITNERFEVFTAVTMKNGVFWDVTPCGSCKNHDE
jgi:hypothetical protein